MLDTRTDIKVKLTGTDGNAFSIMSKVSKALKRGGHSELVKVYMEEAMSGDYSNLLCVTSDYVIVS